MRISLERELKLPVLASGFQIKMKLEILVLKILEDKRILLIENLWNRNK